MLVLLALLQTSPIFSADVDYAEPDPIVAAKQLTDADSHMRYTTAEAIAQHPEIAQKLITNLCTAYRVEKDGTVRAWLINAIGHSGVYDRTVDAVLQKALNDENAYCALYATDACI